MSKITKTTWECDGCDDREVTEPIRQPHGWIGVSIHQTPEHADPMHGRRYHLCPSCATQVGNIIDTEIRSLA